MGHQIHGLFTLMILQGVEDIYFDGNMFIRKQFRYQHINKEQQIQATTYLQEVVKRFISLYNQTPKQYTQYKHAHELENIPPIPLLNTIYSLDNVFYYKSRGIIQDLDKVEENIYKIAPLFINPSLPPSSIKENEIVLHIRLGDAMKTPRRDSIEKQNKSLCNLIPILKKRYPSYTYVIHTDGDPVFFTKELHKYDIGYRTYLKSTPILNVFSDFIHSRVFICGCSSLSTVSTFVGDKELIIVDDMIRHDYSNKNIYKISDFISLYYE